MASGPGHPSQRLERAWRYSEPPVSTLTYRSRAAAPLAAFGIDALLGSARIRNKSLGVTGMLLFGGDQFYQWLEGPPEGVATVWEAIKIDPRHCDVELIDHHHQSVRLFGEWDMKYLRREANDGDAPAASPSALPPQLISHMALLAVRGGEEAIVEGLEELLLRGHEFLSLHGALLEPAARLLGDWWLEDRIRAAEITIALSYLQSAVRRIGAAQTDALGRVASDHSILMAAQPGEPHGLGVALVGDAFRRSGWWVTSEFPNTVAALATSVRSHRFDALSLCLSDVLERAEQIVPLAEAIRAARFASANPALVVLAGGRLFQKQPGLAAFIGADAVYAGAAEALAKTATQMALSEDAAEDEDRRSAPSVH